MSYGCFGKGILGFERWARGKKVILCCLFNLVVCFLRLPCMALNFTLYGSPLYLVWILTLPCIPFYFTLYGALLYLVWLSTLSSMALNFTLYAILLYLVWRFTLPCMPITLYCMPFNFIPYGALLWMVCQELYMVWC